MPTVQILNLCDDCLELVKDAFNATYSQQREKGKCEMCGKEAYVQRVRIDGRADERTDRSVPPEGVS